jgi:hypothetical protein
MRSSRGCDYFRSAAIKAAIIIVSIQPQTARLVKWMVGNKTIFSAHKLVTVIGPVCIAGFGWPIV